MKEKKSIECFGASFKLHHYILTSKIIKALQVQNVNVALNLNTYKKN